MHDLDIDRSWTLFLDRDGVINRRIVDGYVRRWDQFEFLPGVLDALKILARKFGRIIVVSNQQGIGKGLMTEPELQLIHNSMVRQIEGAGGRIDLVLHAPHLASDRSPMRKPGIGMALEAKSIFPEIDFEKCVMAGDSDSDMQFGRNAGMKTVLISEDPQYTEIPDILVDFVYKDLLMVSRDL